MTNDFDIDELFENTKITPNKTVKEEIKNSIGEYIIEKILKTLEENIDCLIKVKNKFHYLGYFENEQAIETKIEA